MEKERKIQMLKIKIWDGDFFEFLKKSPSQIKKLLKTGKLCDTMTK